MGEEYVEIGEEKGSEEKTRKKDEKESVRTKLDGKENKKTSERKKMPRPKSPAAKPGSNPRSKKRDRRATERVKKIKAEITTDIDRMYEIIRDKGMINLKKVAKNMKIDIELAEEWGRVLEEHEMIDLHYPPIGEPVFIVKKFIAGKKPVTGKKKRKLKPGKGVFIINLAVLAVFVAFLTSFMVSVPSVRISYSQLYLAAGSIIIIVLAVLGLKFRRGIKGGIGKVISHDKKKRQKKSKKTGKEGKK